MFLCFSLVDPPHIKGSGAAEEVSVVVNNVLELQCEALGIPAPSLTWLKDGRPLPQTDSLHLLRGGEVLRVASAQVSGLVCQWWDLYKFNFRSHQFRITIKYVKSYFHDICCT